MDYTKTITPSYETIGRRQKLTGFIGQITDESGVVLHSHEYSTNGEAETALNAITFDLLTDLAERGLSDAVPTRIIIGRPCPTCGDEGDCPDCGTYTESLLADIARVLDMALGNTHGAASVVAELQRIRARIGQVQGCTTA